MQNRGASHLVLRVFQLVAPRHFAGPAVDQAQAVLAFPRHTALEQFDLIQIEQLVELPQFGTGGKVTRFLLHAAAREIQ